MPFNGSGVFVRNYSWVADAAANIPITASRMDNDTNDITGNGLGLCLTRDGQGIATANLPMGGFRHTGISDGTAVTQYASVGQIQGGKITFAAAGGSSDVITAAFTPTVVTLVNGMEFNVTATAANSTATPTFSPDTLTARVITKQGGIALAIGDIPRAGYPMTLRYASAGPRYELLNPATLSGTAILDTLGSTQGNILYRNATVWTVLAPGTAGQLLQTNGAGANPSYVSPPKVQSQFVTTTGTFAIPSTATSATVFKFTAVGGGGGGGGSNGTNAPGGGGGAGGSSITWFSGFTVSTNVTITIGAAGAAGAAPGTGGTGGTTKITYAAVDVVTCVGGTGGTAGAAATTVLGGAAGVVTNTIGASGLTLQTGLSALAQPGGAALSVATACITGVGGSSPLGAGGAAVLTGTNGSAGSGFGAGGAGGLGTVNTGGAGTAGAVLVEWVL